MTRHPRRRLPRRTADVPTLLNRLQVLAVAACVLFGVITAGLQLLAWQANRAAADNTEQLVRVQKHPVHAAPGGRARHQRVPDRRARAACPACRRTTMPSTR